jgi:hypothetical protein
MAQDDIPNHKEKTFHESESEFHGHDGPLFDSQIPGRAPPGTFQPRLERRLCHFDLYFQEIQRVVDYLIRSVDRLRYLRQEDVNLFEDARRYHRSGTGEDPLRAWELNLHAMVRMLRDIQEEALPGAHLDI